MAGGLPVPPAQMVREHETLEDWEDEYSVHSLSDSDSDTEQKVRRVSSLKLSPVTKSGTESANQLAARQLISSFVNPASGTNPNQFTSVATIAPESTSKITDEFKTVGSQSNNNMSQGHPGLRRMLPYLPNQSNSTIQSQRQSPRLSEMRYTAAETTAKSDSNHPKSMTRCEDLNFESIDLNEGLNKLDVDDNTSDNDSDAESWQEYLVPEEMEKKFKEQERELKNQKQQLREQEFQSIKHAAKLQQQKDEIRTQATELKQMGDHFIERGNLISQLKLQLSRFERALLKAKEDNQILKEEKKILQQYADDIATVRIEDLKANKAEIERYKQEMLAELAIERARHAKEAEDMKQETAKATEDILMMYSGLMEMNKKLEGENRSLKEAGGKLGVKYQDLTVRLTSANKTCNLLRLEKEETIRRVASLEDSLKEQVERSERLTEQIGGEAKVHAKEKDDLHIQIKSLKTKLMSENHRADSIEERAILSSSSLRKEHMGLQEALIAMETSYQEMQYKNKADAETMQQLIEKLHAEEKAKLHYATDLSALHKEVLAQEEKSAQEIKITMQQKTKFEEELKSLTEKFGDLQSLDDTRFMDSIDLTENICELKSLLDELIVENEKLTSNLSSFSCLKTKFSHQGTLTFERDGVTKTLLIGIENEAAVATLLEFSDLLDKLRKAEIFDTPVDTEILPLAPSTSSSIPTSIIPSIVTAKACSSGQCRAYYESIIKQTSDKETALQKELEDKRLQWRQSLLDLREEMTAKKKALCKGHAQEVEYLREEIQSLAEQNSAQQGNGNVDENLPAEDIHAQCKKEMKLLTTRWTDLVAKTIIEHNRAAKHLQDELEKQKHQLLLKHRADIQAIMRARKEEEEINEEDEEEFGKACVGVAGTREWGYMGAFKELMRGQQKAEEEIFGL